MSKRPLSQIEVLDQYQQQNNPQTPRKQTRRPSSPFTRLRRRFGKGRPMTSTEFNRRISDTSTPLQEEQHLELEADDTPSKVLKTTNMERNRNVDTAGRTVGDDESPPPAPHIADNQSPDARSSPQLACDGQSTSSSQQLNLASVSVTRDGEMVEVRVSLTQEELIRILKDREIASEGRTVEGNGTQGDASLAGGSQ